MTHLYPYAKRKLAPDKNVRIFCKIFEKMTFSKCSLWAPHTDSQISALKPAEPAKPQTS